MTKKQISLRVDELTTMRLTALVEMTGQSKTQLIASAIGEYYTKIRKEIETMDDKNEEVFYCKAGGHFWRYGENGEPLYIGSPYDMDVENMEYADKYCGCNE